MSQLFCSRRASSAGQALPNPSKFVPGGREQRTAWSSALGPFLGGATFHSLEAWDFYWEEVVPERGRGKGCCHYLCGPLESPSKPRRKTGSSSEMPWRRFQNHYSSSVSRLETVGPGPLPPPRTSFFLSFPSLPRLSPVSALLHKPDLANWGQKREDEGPRGAKHRKKGFNRSGWG